jgi:hypothetical protein
MVRGIGDEMTRTLRLEALKRIVRHVVNMVGDEEG